MTLYAQFERDIVALNKYQLKKNICRQCMGKDFHLTDFKQINSIKPIWKPQGDAFLSRWECLGPEGGNVNDMLMDPTNPAIIYVAPATTPCPIFKSTDAGKSWNVVGIVDISVFAMAIDPNNPSTLYAGGSIPQVYKSTDGGVNWTGYQFSTDYNWVYALAINPADPNIIYAGIDYWNGSDYTMGVMKSTNGGSQWQIKSFDTDYGAGYSIAIDPQYPDTVFVGGRIGQSAKVFKTADGGTNWTDISSALIGNSVNSLTIHPDTTTIIFAGTYQYLFKSKNGGESWDVSGYFSTNDLTINTRTPDIMYAGSNGEVYKSTDCGVSWNGTGNGTAMTNITTILTDPTSADIVYAGGQSGILKTVNGGTDWAISNKGFIAAPVSELVVPQTAPNILYIAIDDDALFKSEDRGQSWKRLEEFEGCTGVIDLAVAPNSPDTLYVLSGG